MPTKINVPMRPRSSHEPHRTATSLELLFDLVFVVAIAQAAAGLHHTIAEGHASDGILKFVMLFFAIWWAWMGFTWFATSFDTDDAAYRMTVFVQLAGALILAAGVSVAFNQLDFTMVAGGYVVMRVAMVTQWLRAGIANPEQRRGCLRMAFGVAFVQALWVGLMFAPDSWFFPGFWILIAAELAVPIWGWQKLSANVNPHHIAERYGLLTIIVLGETVLAAYLAASAAIEAQAFSTELLPILAGGLLIVFALWWLYFDSDATKRLTSRKRAFLWGYGHYLIFASGAAIGAGIAVAVDVATNHADISSRQAAMAVAIPVAIFLVSMFAMHQRKSDSVPSKLADYSAVALVLLAPLIGQPVLAIGIVLAILVALNTVVFASEESSAGSSF